MEMEEMKVKLYNVLSDQKFFDEIVSTKTNVQHIASTFQNSDSIADENEISEWLIEITETINKLNQIRDEGLSRFKLIEVKQNNK